MLQLVSTRYTVTPTPSGVRYKEKSVSKWISTNCPHANWQGGCTQNNIINIFTLDFIIHHYVMRLLVYLCGFP